MSAPLPGVARASVRAAVLLPPLVVAATAAMSVLCRLSTMASSSSGCSSLASRSSR